MKINNKQILKNFNGDELKSQDSQGVVVSLSVGEAISNILIGNQAGGRMKMVVLAQRFYTEDETTLDAADFGLIKEAIDKTQVYQGNLVPGTLLVYLDSLKEE